LVLDGIQDTLGSPVNIVSGNVINNKSSNFDFLSLLDLKTKIGLDEFLVGDVHELVEVHFIGLFGAFIESLDHLVVSVEDGKSVPFLVGG